MAITELQAVNYILGKVGTSPVTAISASSPPDVLLAQSLFLEVLKDRQAEGYYWNTLYTTTPDPDGSGVITVSSSWLSVDTRGANRNTHVVQVGLELFDVENDTNVFDGALEVIVIVERDLSDVPHTFVGWVIAEAARKFQAIQVGDSQRDQQLRADEMEAKAKAMADDISDADVNIADIKGPARDAVNRFFPPNFTPY